MSDRKVSVATLVRPLRPRKIHGWYKILDQLVLEIVFIYVLSCLYSIVLYRETEDEFYRIKESKWQNKHIKKKELKNELTLLAAS